MQTKKEKILIQPFVEANYKNHRRKVNSAQAVIDATCPPHQPHVSIKSKKLQKERERLAQIERENRRLLRKLSQIMITNRVENYWKDPHPNFLSRVALELPKPKQRIQSASAQSSVELDRGARRKSASCARCPTCSGKPIVDHIQIPEERVPFEPPRKSWNLKLLTEKPKVHKCCKFCC